MHNNGSRNATVTVVNEVACFYGSWCILKRKIERSTANYCATAYQVAYADLMRWHIWKVNDGGGGKTNIL